MSEKKTKDNQIDTSDKNLEKVIKISRVTKVVKGGKRLAFRSVVVVGDRKSNVSFGIGKARDVPTSIKKAIDKAYKSLFKVYIVDSTIPHEVLGKFGSTKVLIKPAKYGTGVIAGSSAKIIFEAAGIENIVAKVYGSRNPINVALATLNGLNSLLSVNEVESRRNVKLSIYQKSKEESNVTN